jgi:putative phosphoesterase
MRIAVVSDIHGNLTALEAVLADLKLTSPDLIFHGGDLGYGGARPAEVVDRIVELGWPGVCGNTDEMLWAPEELQKFAEKSPTFQWMFSAIQDIAPEVAARLGEDRMRWLKALPCAQRLSSMALVHASPSDLWRAPLPDASNEELCEVFGGLETPMVVYAHIHRPFVREMATMTVANTGSVSLSYDGDLRASYLIIDQTRVSADEQKVWIRRVEYDLEPDAQELLRSGLPHAEWLCRMLRGGGIAASA